VLLGLVRTALRAEDLGILTEDELLEAFLAGAALIFVDRHGNAFRNHR
jgi:isopentenyl diphosphate isomerase/L-lactate dehydrogenase-like FMN-dependent dehydrogenase